MQTLYLSEGTAARRRVYLRLVQSADGVSAATSSQVTAGKARLIANGADGGDTTNDIVQIHATNMPGWWYVELTAGEITALGVGNHAVRFKEADTLESIGGQFQIVAWDWWAAGVPVLSIANNAITAAAIADNAITAAKIATDAITAAKIAADAIGASELATDAVAEIVAAVYAQVVEGSLTMLQHTRISAAVLYGKSTDGGVKYRDTGDTKNRVVATVDGSGNRTAVTLDGT